MRNCRILLCTLIMLLLCYHLQAESSIRSIRESRFRKIGFYHIGAEIGVNGIENLDGTVLLLAGCGSNRNLLNVDFGIGYNCSTVLPASSTQYITGHRIPVVISAAVNVWRDEKDCFYIGGGYSYGIAVGSVYKGPAGTFSDKKLLMDSSVPFAELGYRFNMFDVSFRGSYATAPKYDQKYIYETEAYDYTAVKKQIFNRLQLGLTFTYYFCFGL